MKKKTKEPNATEILGANPSGADYECLDELRKIYEKKRKKRKDKR